ncbi:APC family permease [Paraburkholderia sp. BL10I2N1]|uniref:APC family permease n=1 Tax=Paraburkholderia sp. BL10I2N1 TaxID=1938796 RepID=UPI00105FEFFC|nr:APC family permease [Paraburkholderia sp. BL10I2N1]TDN58704.1 amino acid transporter [Paraburkholderia sp. BL10I2N1]
MKFSEIIGYDRYGTVRELKTALNHGTLDTKDVTLSALGFNAPAWVAASSMSILYAITGHRAPLAILIAYFFPMLVLAFSMVSLTRHAPSAGGIFTFSSRFLHPNVGTILGWTYTVACTAVTPMCALIGTEYIQALCPSVGGVLNAKIIGALMILGFFAVSCRGVGVTAKVAGTFLIFEIAVVAGLGLLGILHPRVEGLSLASMYSLRDAGGLAGIGPGVLFGVWMLANFDSAINYIEEARVPVRTVQRSMLLVLTSAFVIYSLAAIGWQYAVPVDKLAAIVENGNGGPISAVANAYLPPSVAWLALFVVITSAAAGLQISSNAAARTLYRMSEEGHLPAGLGVVNRHKAPWLATALVSIAGIALVWWKPLDKIVWYYDVVTITLVASYISALAAFIVLTWRQQRLVVAVLLSAPALLAVGALAYIGYTAGANPVSPEDLYNAWYMGAATLVAGMLIVIFHRRGNEGAATENLEAS